MEPQNISPVGRPCVPEKTPARRKIKAESDTLSATLAYRLAIAKINGTAEKMNAAVHKNDARGSAWSPMTGDIPVSSRITRVR